MRISDWSSDVCSSDLARFLAGPGGAGDVQMRPLHLAGETMQEHRADGRAGFARATRGAVGDVGELALDVVITVRPHRPFPGTITPLFAGAEQGPADRSEDRRVGKEWCSTCTFRW